MARPKLPKDVSLRKTTTTMGGRTKSTTTYSDMATGSWTVTNTGDASGVTVGTASSGTSITVPGSIVGSGGYTTPLSAYDPGTYVYSTPVDWGELGKIVEEIKELKKEGSYRMGKKDGLKEAVQLLDKCNSLLELYKAINTLKENLVAQIEKTNG